MATDADAEGAIELVGGPCDGKVLCNYYRSTELLRVPVLVSDEYVKYRDAKYRKRADGKFEFAGYA